MNIPSDDELRVIVAELCGWKLEYLETPPVAWDVIKPDGKPHSETVYSRKKDAISKLPNYPEDLNACASFEQTLTTKDEITDYINQLYSIAFEPGRDRDYGVVFATARQRCVAFLITKWKIK